MKVLIAYSTRTGCCADCADLLASKLSYIEVDKVNLCESEPDPEKYDVIVVGGGIRMGKIYKETAAFMKKYAEVLKKKKSGYFICCAYTDRAVELIEKNIPRELRIASFCCDSFGGDLRIDRLKGINKLIMKAAKRSIENDAEHESSTGDGEFARVLPAIVPENIFRFADKIHQLCLNK